MEFSIFNSSDYDKTSLPVRVVQERREKDVPTEVPSSPQASEQAEAPTAEPSHKREGTGAGKDGRRRRLGSAPSGTWSGRPCAAVWALRQRDTLFSLDDILIYLIRLGGPGL